MKKYSFGKDFHRVPDPIYEKIQIFSKPENIYHGGLVKNILSNPEYIFKSFIINIIGNIFQDFEVSVYITRNRRAKPAGTAICGSV